MAASVELMTASFCNRYLCPNTWEIFVSAKACCSFKVFLLDRISCTLTMHGYVIHEKRCSIPLTTKGKQTLSYFQET